MRVRIPSKRSMSGQSDTMTSFTYVNSTSTGQAKERPHLLVLAFPLYALAA